MATFTLAAAEPAQQWQGGSTCVKMIVGTVTMNDAGAGGYTAGGEACDLSDYFDTFCWGGHPVAIDAAASGGVKFSIIQATNAPLIVAHRDPVDAGAAQSMFEEVTAGVDLSALTATWVFYGF